jgi:predicted deacylase
MRALAEDVNLARVGRYRGLTEAYEAFGALGACEVGRTHEDRPLVRLELGPADAPKVTLVIAGLHAMEWIGVETALALAHAWRADPARDRRLVLLPLLNPDGYAKVERLLRSNTWRFTRSNAHGVDLNRNFATHFRSRHFWPSILPFLGGPGASPGSEPETRATLDALERDRGRIDRAVSLHSFGKKLLLPHGGRWKHPPDYDALVTLAREVNRGLGNRYAIHSSSHWVPGAFAYGMELDHFHAEGIAPLLVECSAGGLSLFDPGTWLHPFRWFNPRDPEVQSLQIANALRSFVAPNGGS